MYSIVLKKVGLHDYHKRNTLTESVHRDPLF